MSDTETALKDLIAAEPEVREHWLVWADWLEESGREEAAELVRLRLELTAAIDVPDREQKEKRLRVFSLYRDLTPPVVSRVNTLGMELVLIPPGKFLMGVSEKHERWSASELSHPVTLSRAFWMGRYPVTQKEYRAVMDVSPSYFHGDQLPVEHVSWDEAEEFCRRLSERSGERSNGLSYWLPTEAEWEYACRAGASGVYHWGNDDAPLRACGWFRENADERSHEVGQKRPNPWGLYDMYGNVREWCRDDLAPYAREETVNPMIVQPNRSERVCRGGSWGSRYFNCRSVSRCGDQPANRTWIVGFRVAAKVAS